MTNQGEDLMKEKEGINRAGKADKIALGAGAVLTIAFAAGLHVARKSGETLRRYTALSTSQQEKDYWQVDFIQGEAGETRYFHGSERAIRRRLKYLSGEMQVIKKLSAAEVQAIKTNQVRIIEI